jgi:hypothetical protein
VVVGVHTPETEGEKVTENVERETKKLGIDYPVLIDTTAANWRRWEQQWWPCIYLIDKRGHARFRWAGELEWKGAGGEAKLTARIEQLLKEK